MARKANPVTVAVGIIFVGVGAVAILRREQLLGILGIGGEPFPPEPMPEPGPEPEPVLCEQQFAFDVICIAVTQQAQDELNRFMQYRVIYQNVSNDEVTFDLIGQFKNQDGTVEDLQARRQTIGPGERKEFTFNFIWVTPGFKEVDFFGWTSIQEALPVSLRTTVNTLVM